MNVNVVDVAVRGKLDNADRADFVRETLVIVGVVAG